MLRLTVIAAFATLAVVCLAQETLEYASLSNPTLVALEETIKESVAKHEPFIRVYNKKDTLNHKIWWISRDWFDESRNVIVEEVLTKMSDKVHASNKEETKKTILEACETLNQEAEEVLAEADSIVNLGKLDKFLERDESLVRAYNLATFCKFL